MADSISNKRKGRGGSGRDERGPKRSKGGSGGKWQTPHQKAKVDMPRGGRIEVGDAGIFVTCARNQENRAAEEIKGMFEECVQRFYGIIPDSEAHEEDEEDDIEASIRKEVASMENQKQSPKLFTLIHLDVPCVIFFKTGPAVEPLDFVHRICKEVVAKPDIRKMRYVNRLTPVTSFAKATEKGLEEVAKNVLPRHFRLNVEGTENQAEDTTENTTYPSYAIRPTTRNHNTLKRDAVIKQVASSISDFHKVDLTNPDKTILVEIYQTVCGLSVVGNDWEKLKRYNLAELYPSNKVPPSPKVTASSTGDAGTKPESVATDEAPLVPIDDTNADKAAA